MMRRSSKQAGFSLVELLVTALIFGIGLLGLAALQVSTLRSNSGGRNRVTASSLAEGCLSAIQSEGSLSWSYAAGVLGSTPYAGARTFTDSANSGNVPGNFGFFDVNGQPVAAGDPNRVFQVTWTRLPRTVATPAAPLANMNMSEYVVTVLWRDQELAANGAGLPDSSLTLSRLIRYGV